MPIMELQFCRFMEELMFSESDMEVYNNMNVYKSVMSSPSQSGSGGDVSIDSFEITTLPTKLVYNVGDSLDTTGMVVTATADGMSGNVKDRCTFSHTQFNTIGKHTVLVGYHNKQDTFDILVSEGTIGTLEETSWSLIKTVASAGLGDQFWSIGDTKSVTVNGQIGDSTGGRTLNNVSLKVFIIDFNYRGDNGIYFQCFKDSTGQIDIGIDGEFKQSLTDGTKMFNMQHWGSLSFGGWKGCDARYDILGSTDVPPSGYGATTTSAREGYDATSTCATNPVQNTFMSALPSDLRSVIAPWTIWTDNVGLGYDTSHVTTSVDYLPLIAEY